MMKEREFRMELTITQQVIQYFAHKKDVRSVKELHIHQVQMESVVQRVHVDMQRYKTHKTKLTSNL